MKTVYICISTDIIHSGHINVIRQARALGEVTVGALCDECAAMYERYPLLPLTERLRVLENIKGVNRVVVQNDIYYDEILQELRPDYVVHGDNWRVGYQKPIRERVIQVLAQWGGQLVEIPYTKSSELSNLSKNFREKVGLPETRRQRLRRLLQTVGFVRTLEAHDGLSALLVENTRVAGAGGVQVYDAIWISSLCDSTIKGKPDIELVDLTSRLQTVNEILDVTTKPVIFDADTGGQLEHFAYNIKTMERAGISAIIIEDKKGLKRNSLLGNDVVQTQEDLEVFCEKLRIGKESTQSSDFMIIARIESLILDKGIEDALTRAKAYVAAGADGIMIHARNRTPEQVFAFCDRFREMDKVTPLVVVPTTFNDVSETSLKAHGINVVIYANHLLRASFPAMKRVADLILTEGCSKSAEELCMRVSEILSLVPFDQQDGERAESPCDC